MCSGKQQRTQSKLFKLYHLCVLKKRTNVTDSLFSSLKSKHASYHQKLSKQHAALKQTVHVPFISSSEMLTKTGHN